MEKLIAKYHLLTCNENWADEHNVPALIVFNEKDYQKWKKTKIYPVAELGNNGYGWLEDVKGQNVRGQTGAEMLGDGIVSHYIVDELFAKTFKRAKLADLNLSNIFELDQSSYLDNYDDLDDEE